MFKITNEPTNWRYLGIVALFGIAAAGLIVYSFKKYEIAEPVIMKKEIKPVYLSLSADKASINLNELVKVTVLLDSLSEKNVGTDVILNYDPEFLEIQPVSSAVKTKKQIKDEVLEPKNYLDTTASFFNIFPYLRVNNLVGSIIFSALANPSEEVSGKGSVATLIFKAIKKGNVKIDISFKSGSSVDSNVAYMGRDILTGVSGVELNIK
ncbi:MAG: cohesin domain-containing protein [Patescibacteria group bacterium]